jgi:hypothetical protein
MYVSLEAEARRRFLAAAEIEERRDAEMERMSAYWVNDDVQRADEVQPRGRIGHFTNDWNNWM